MNIPDTIFTRDEVLALIAADRAERALSVSVRRLTFTRQPGRIVAHLETKDDIPDDKIADVFRLALGMFAPAATSEVATVIAGLQDMHDRMRDGFSSAEPSRALLREAIRILAADRVVPDGAELPPLAKLALDTFNLALMCDGSAKQIAAARRERDKLIAAIAADRASASRATPELSEMEARKDAAYLERNQVVAAFAKCFPSGVARTAIEGWSEDWHGCVYIDLPTGQASWHFHDSQAYLFDGLPAYAGTWDGHDTPEKYRRLAALTTNQAAPAAVGATKAVALSEERIRRLQDAIEGECDGMAIGPEHARAILEWVDGIGLDNKEPK